MTGYLSASLRSAPPTPSVSASPSHLPLRGRHDGEARGLRSKAAASAPLSRTGVRASGPPAAPRWNPKDARRQSRMGLSVRPKGELPTSEIEDLPTRHRAEWDCRFAQRANCRRRKSKIYRRGTARAGRACNRQWRDCCPGGLSPTKSVTERSCLPLEGVRAPGKQSSGLFSARTGRQAPGTVDRRRRDG